MTPSAARIVRAVYPRDICAYPEHDACARGMHDRCPGWCDTTSRGLCPCVCHDQSPPPGWVDAAAELRAAGWKLWTFANPELAVGDLGVWADPTSLDHERRVGWEQALSDQRERDAGTLF